MNLIIACGRGEHLSNPFKAMEFDWGMVSFIQDFTECSVRVSLSLCSFRCRKESLQKAFRAALPGYGAVISAAVR
jgi:hypothetical protein